MTVLAAPAPRLLPAPRVLEVLGNRLELLAEGSESPRASVVRYTVAPGFAAPPVLHAHVSDDVTMIVIEGALVVAGPDGEVEVCAGSTMVIPHGAPFAWRNASADEPAVYLGVYAPGGFEQYFVAVADVVAERGGLTPDIVAPLWEQYGIALA